MFISLYIGCRIRVFYMNIYYLLRNTKNIIIDYKGGFLIFVHKKQLLHEVKVEKPNPQYAVLIQEQLGG